MTTFTEIVTHSNNIMDTQLHAVEKGKSSTLPNGKATDWLIDPYNTKKAGFGKCKAHLRMPRGKLLWNLIIFIFENLFFCLVQTFYINSSRLDRWDWHLTRFRFQRLGISLHSRGCSFVLFSNFADLKMRRSNICLNLTIFFNIITQTHQTHQ